MHFSTWTATRILERARDAALEGLARRATDTEGHIDDASTLQKILENLPDDLLWWLALAALNCLVFVPPIIFVSVPLPRRKSQRLSASRSTSALPSVSQPSASRERLCYPADPILRRPPSTRVTSVTDSVADKWPRLVIV